MISSLQQLHSAARQSRNFLSNFQVAFRRATPEGIFGLNRREHVSREGKEERCAVCESDLEDLVRNKRRKTPLRVV